MNETHPSRLAMYVMVGALLLWGHVARAETIHLINGDLIQARVLSLDETWLNIRSEILGSLQIPRDKIARIDFVPIPGNTGGLTGADKARTAPPAPVPGAASIPSTVPGSLTGAHAADLIEQVRQQMLTTAGPEANQMYQDLVGGVVSGKIDVPQLKTMAEDTVTRIEELQAELGEDVGFALDGYLNILRAFIRKAESGEAQAGPTSRADKSESP